MNQWVARRIYVTGCGGCTGVVLRGGSSGWVGGVTSPDIFLGCSKEVEYVHFIRMYPMPLKQD